MTAAFANRSLVYWIGGLLISRGGG